MRISFLSASLAVSAGVAALPQPGTPFGDAPALPPEAFNTVKHPVLSVEEILNRAFAVPLKDTVKGILGDSSISVKINNLLSGPPAAAPKSETPPKAAVPESEAQTLPPLPADDATSAPATCTNPRVHREWDSISDDDKQAFVDALLCLHKKPPSGKFPGAQSRYEDIVVVHQLVTPHVHNCSKFAVFHRLFLKTFQDILETECGYQQPMPWVDMRKNDGDLTKGSFFTAKWFGSINSFGNCVTDGQFANLVINVGPGTTNTRHCLSRNNDKQNMDWIRHSGEVVHQWCKKEKTWAPYTKCLESCTHGWAHVGMGGVMADTFGSPSEVFFWGVHLQTDNDLRTWQSEDPTRLVTIDGQDAFGHDLTMDTMVSVVDIAPSVPIRDLMNIQGGYLCYTYDY